MKIAVLFLFVVLANYLPLACYAHKRVPHTLPDGFWVVEGNLNYPMRNVVYFYNMQKVLIYKEDISGIKIHLNRSGVRKRLNKVLAEVLSRHELNGPLKQNDYLLSAVLNRNFKRSPLVMH